MRTETLEIYTFDELSESAKEKAREWFKNDPCFFDFGAECVIEDATEIAGILGIDIDQIYYSGFCCQGDGACFAGSYTYKPGAIKAIQDYAPLDTRLHAIAKALQEVQRPNFYQLCASVQHSGYYYHEYCMDVSIERNDEKEMTATADDDLTEALRDFARWIYRQLEQAYEYENSDECVDENIRCNEYEFYVTGAPA